MMGALACRNRIFAIADAADASLATPGAHQNLGSSGSDAAGSNKNGLVDRRGAVETELNAPLRLSRAGLRGVGLCGAVRLQFVRRLRSKGGEIDSHKVLPSPAAFAIGKFLRCNKRRCSDRSAWNTHIGRF